MNNIVSHIENQNTIKTDILFIIPPFHRRNGGGSFFPLGIGYIITQVEIAGFSWEIIDCTEYIDTFNINDLNKLSEKLQVEISKYNPLIIGIGPCITTQVRALKLISEKCRQILPNVPVFAGGPLASIDKQEWLFYEELGIDYLIKGDGEVAVIDAIRAVKEENNILDSDLVSYDGYSYINIIDDINSLQFPYRFLTNKDKFSVRRSNEFELQAAMITSRGCLYNCKFCVSGNLAHNNARYRKRTNENIIDEIQYLNNKYGVSDIVFYDDCFFSNIKTINNDILTFCKLLLDRGIKSKWQIEMRPDIFCEVSNDGIKKLEEAGCRQINLGIEKISNKGLLFLGKANHWSDLKQRIKSVKSISQISISATFILGGEKETKCDVIKLVEQSKELGLDYAHYNPLFIYPGTALYNKLYSDKKEWYNIILNDNLPWGEIVYENKDLNKESLLELVDYAYYEFYKETRFIDQAMVRDRFNIK